MSLSTVPEVFAELDRRNYLTQGWQLSHEGMTGTASLTPYLGLEVTMRSRRETFDHAVIRPHLRLVARPQEGAWVATPWYGLNSNTELLMALRKAGQTVLRALTRKVVSDDTADELLILAAGFTNAMRVITHGETLTPCGSPVQPEPAPEPRTVILGDGS